MFCDSDHFVFVWQIETMITLKLVEILIKCQKLWLYKKARKQPRLFIKKVVVYIEARFLPQECHPIERKLEVRLAFEFLVGCWVCGIGCWVSSSMDIHTTQRSAFFISMESFRQFKFRPKFYICGCVVCNTVLPDCDISRALSTNQWCIWFMSGELLLIWFNYNLSVDK